MIYNGYTEDAPTKFTFYATGSNGAFVREFENKSDTWPTAVYEFVQFLKGMGFYIDDDYIQVRDTFVSKNEPPVYNNLSDTVFN